MNNPIYSKGISSLKVFWKEDLKAGFNVSLMALPLCLGITIASGFPPIAGLFAAVVGGIFVSRFNGSWLTITGPAAGLIVVNLAAIETLGGGDKAVGYPYALAAIVVSGLFIALFGFLKLGKFGDFFPNAAVHGMLAAIGIIIVIKQFFVAAGVSVHGHEFFEVLSEVPGAFLHSNPEVILIAIVSLLILIFYPKIKTKWIKILPAPIWVLLVAIPLEFMLDFEHEHVVNFLGSEHKVGPQLLVHLPDSILDAVQLPDFGKITTGAFWVAVVSITLVTAIESLLSAIAIDGMDENHRKTNLNKDLKALGVGSSFSGMIGGLPMISEIVRSTANADGGAKTQWSNLFHGVFLLLFMFVGSIVIDHIPLAALAAMLIYTGFRLASPKEFKHMWQIGKTEFAVFLVTIIVVLTTDLLIGIAAGIVLNMVILILKNVSIGNLFKVRFITTVSGDAVVIKLKDSVVFTNYLGLKKEIVKYADKHIALDFAEVTFIDHSVKHHLIGLKRDFETKDLSFERLNTDKLVPLNEHYLAEERGK
jgi:MFS superfamily sulfate permease-like transporter